jgi:uncharacterized protein YigA (DUF484 family)
MSKQPVGQLDEDAIEETAIADYLQGNPDFFERHATLLTKLKLPHNRGTSAISLVERQVAALRDKNEKLESRLRELIEVARGNDVLAAKIHRLACRLVRAEDASRVMEAIEASLDRARRGALPELGGGEHAHVLAVHRAPVAHVAAIAISDEALQVGAITRIGVRGQAAFDRQMRQEARQPRKR